MPKKYTNNLDMRNFISAIVMLSKKPVILRKIFTEQISNRSGIYKLLFYKNGKQTIVCIDDLIPCA